MKVTTDRPVRVRILDENGTLRAMPDILADLQSRYGETLDAFEAAEIKEAFGTDEAMKMINALYGQEAAVRANAEALSDAAGRGAEFTAEMARAADSNWDASMVLMSQKIDVLQQMIGERLLPVVQRITPYIDAFIASAFQWIDANPELITGIGTVVVGLGALAAIIAPILLATSTLVSGWAMMSYGATRLGLAVFKLGKWVAGAGKWLMWLGRVVLPLVGKAVIWIGRALLANPIGTIIMGIATTAFLLYKYWEPISGFFSDLWATVSGVMVSAWEGIKSWFQSFSLVRIIMQNWDGIIGFFAGLWSRIKAGVSAGWELIKNLFFDYTPLGLVITHWDGIVDFFAGLWDDIKLGVTNGWEAIKALFLGYTPVGIIYTHWDGLAEWFGTLWADVKTTFTQKWTEIKAEVATWPSKMKEYGADIIQKLIDGIKAKIGALKKAVSDALSALNPFSNVPVNVNMQVEARNSAENPGESGLSADRQAEVLAAQRARLKEKGVPGYARGGSFGPGPIRVGEAGEELIYANQAGFVAHNGALRGMLSMASRAREIAQGIDFGSFGLGTSPVPALATVAASGGGSQRGPITLSPQYNMPLNFAAGVDMDEVRATVRNELMDAEERMMAASRGLLHD